MVDGVVLASGAVEILSAAAETAALETEPQVAGERTVAAVLAQGRSILLLQQQRVFTRLDVQLEAGNLDTLEVGLVLHHGLDQGFQGGRESVFHREYQLTGETVDGQRGVEFNLLVMDQFLVLFVYTHSLAESNAET